MTKLHDIYKLGQSIWIDQISRELFASGELQSLIDQGLRGMTSNPSIFMKAMTGSDAYDEDLARLIQQGLEIDAVYESLAVSDIQQAADMLRTIFDASDGADGFVSLEANPNLAHETQGTLDEIRRLKKLVNRPNVMFKIPATQAGYPAIQTLLTEGLPINITLMFSLEQYEAVSEAYLKALEARLGSGKPIDRMASVASFFVSRIDSKIDPLLEERGTTDLQGMIAVANAKLAYEQFKEQFGGPRWERLAASGARPQRVLWASTSTKNPAYPDTLYVDNLIGPETVNTLPPETIAAVLDHGTLARTVDRNVDLAREQISRLSQAGIDLDQVTRELLDQGVASFSDAYQKLIANLSQKALKMRAP